MKTAYNYSKKSLKVFSIIFYVLFVICLLLGLISITVGGFVFILFSLLFLYPAYHYSKLAKLKDKIENQNKKTSSNTKMKKSIPGNDYIYVNKKGKSYHWDAHCRSLGLNYDIITRDEARARGLKPCKHCDTY